ncbi:presenilins-associated rhomboid-like protein, mitochondrial isoform X1 [Gadus morhua]|uniref:rhomboid protease n=1 Tax=Gadus morhua TaxID=8049 RepID=A0A8C4Z470_GADMO|nr:presenilins-associated rhomboid-like protein, mitochondrial isoform X1 [Gadus morhua]
MAWRGCVMHLTKTGFIRCTKASPRDSRLNPHNQQRSAFRREAKRTDTNKGNVSQETELAASKAGEPVNVKSPPPPPPAHSPRARPTLFKPFVFTIGFTGCSFGVAAILQYESLKSRFDTVREEAKPNKELKGSEDMTYWHNWWDQLNGVQKQLILLLSSADDLWSSFSEGQRTTAGIIAVNALVLCCWRIPSLQRTMIKYFTANPAAKTRCLPMVLSSFSHYSVFHMVANMYVLWTFSTSIVSLLGREQFIAVYLSAGAISNMVSYCCKTATGRLYPSLGASGAVMTVLAAVCAKVPEAKLGIILLPMVTFTAGNALKALIAIDTAGLVMGWRYLDHAAHLGGALFGVWYVAYGHKVIWRNREPFVKLWHSIRSPGNGGRRPGSGPGSL